MFKVQSIALTAALYGFHHAQTVSAAGCYPAWSTSTSYNPGDKASARISTTTAATTTSCTANTNGCPASGFRTTPATTTVATTNVECTGAGTYCSQFDPAGLVHGTSFWSRDSAACTGTVAVTPPPLWSGGGCPAVFQESTDYDDAALVTVDTGGFTMVYQCTTFPNSQFCGQSGYEPGTGQYWTVAWEELGRCDGTISPTASPVNVVLGEAGGCPNDYDASADYEEADKVGVDGLVYQCKSWPLSQHCSQAGFEPGVSVVTGGSTAVEAWRTAWDVVGHCSGSITPTSSPSFVTLENLGGCPDSWMVTSVGNAYEENDRVEARGLVFSCRAWPFSGFCGQAGYEPLVDSGTPDAWKDAWELVGFCSGSIGPTSSPAFDELETVGACPEEWVQGDQLSYEPDDIVSVSVSLSPIKKVVYRCRAWPNSNHCGQHAPNVFGGELGWSLSGSCEGSIGPTSSPSFDKLGLISNPSGCPQDFSTSDTYEAGDLVSVTASIAPSRKIVYECRAWPNSGYCNQQGSTLDPGEKFGFLGWTLRGSCDGTLAPSMAPVAYAGLCQFIKCETGTSCNVDGPSNGVSGSTACSCRGTDVQSSSCTQTVCTNTDVDTYSTSTTYDVGDVARRGARQFTCRVRGWCNNSVYQPLLVRNLIWPLAWTESGDCPP